MTPLDYALACAQQYAARLMVRCSARDPSRCPACGPSVLRASAIAVVLADDTCWLAFEVVGRGLRRVSTREIQADGVLRDAMEAMEAVR